MCYPIMRTQSCTGLMTVNPPAADWLFDGLACEGANKSQQQLMIKKFGIIEI